MNTIDELPPWIYCAEAGCMEKHYLTLGKDFSGQWSITYRDAEGYGLAHLTLNESSTIEEAARRMKAAIDRQNRRTKPKQ